MMTANLTGLGAQAPGSTLEDARAALARCHFADAAMVAGRVASAAMVESDLVTAYAGQYVAGRALLAMGRGTAAVRAFSAGFDVASGCADLAHKRGHAAHDTFGALIVAGATAATLEEWYSRALRGYGADPVSLNALAADRGYQLLLAHRPAEAAAVLLPVIASPPEQERIASRANFAVACAMAGAPVRARGALSSLRAELERGGCGAAWGWYCDAKTRHILGQPKHQITEAAAAARRLAARNGEESTRAAAAELLRSVS